MGFLVATHLLNWFCDKASFFRKARQSVYLPSQWSLILEHLLEAMLVGENSAWNLAMAIGRNCAQAGEGNETEIGFDIHNDQGWLFVKK